MEEDCSYREDTHRGRLSSFEMASNGENRHLLQNLEDAQDWGTSRQGGKLFLELHIATTTENNL